ncbi:hypothetical protein [Crateriforma conspicua]|uniref:hypothetical protein n=1 Tax=Crateriforma TaxID=2714592 RepID=UPI0011B6CFEF|nr:hypothetical protein [Crateriforma conspicua]
MFAESFRDQEKVEPSAFCDLRVRPHKLETSKFLIGHDSGIGIGNKIKRFSVMFKFATRDDRKARPNQLFAVAQDNKGTAINS